MTHWHSVWATRVSELTCIYGNQILSCPCMTIFFQPKSTLKKNSANVLTPCVFTIWPLRGHPTWSRKLLANWSNGLKCVSVVKAAESYWQVTVAQGWQAVDQNLRPLKDEMGQTETSNVNVLIATKKALLQQRTVNKFTDSCMWDLLTTDFIFYCSENAC